MNSRHISTASIPGGRPHGPDALLVPQDLDLAEEVLVGAIMVQDLLAERRLVDLPHPRTRYCRGLHLQPRHVVAGDCEEYAEVN